MRASTAGSLCTLSALFRSTVKPKLSILEILDSAGAFGSENSHNLLSEQISSILHDGQFVERPDGDRNKLERALDIPWFPSTSHGDISRRMKEVSSSYRKERWMSKHAQENRFGRIIKTWADKLGTEAAFEVIGRVGKEAGMKEFNALIEVCIDKAREADDEEVAVEEMGKAFNLFKLVRQKGYQLQEQTYGPLLLCLIDKGMVGAFQLFFKIIKAENPSSISRLDYYEMMLWLRVGNEEKIRDLCNYVAINNGEHTYGLQGL